MSDQIIFDGNYSAVVNLAMQQNHVPVISRLEIRNTTETPLENIRVIIRTEPQFAHPWETKVDALAAGASLNLGAPALHLLPEYLLGLTERIAGNLLLEAWQGEEKIGSTIRFIDVLAFDEWAGERIMPEILAAFVTPNHPQISALIRRGSEFLQKWTGSPAFTGYLSNNPNVVRMQMAALYEAIRSKELEYCVAPASFEQQGQRVRLCDTIMEQKMANCLDLTLLYAACLEAVGLYPLLILLKGHAFAGCWLEKECFAECVQEDVSLLTKRMAEGINEIAVTECTAAAKGNSAAFEQASAAAQKQLTADAFEYLIDVRRTRGSGIRPLPLRKSIYDGAGYVIEEQAARLDAAAPKEMAVQQKIRQVDSIEITRQQLWERKLLDLSLRNPLLNFRVTQNAIQLLCGNLNELEDALSGGQSFQLMARPKDFENQLRDGKIYEIANGSSMAEDLIRDEFANHRIRTFLEEREVALRVTSLYRAAKTSLEENGTNTLYLALGFLRWYETDVSEKPRYAPIVLLPVDIVRRSAQNGYVVRVRDEEPQMNITLLEMLRVDFGITIGGLDPLPADESGVDLRAVFSTMRQAVMSRSRWDVEEFAFLGLFSFSQFIMWNDIRNRSEELRQNKIVASLISGKMEWQPGEDFPSPQLLDEQYAPADMAIPLSADSSQLAAICAAGKGESFVLHGPPGTGKSQTITNLIANALFQGKSVLFIAEKMAALSVVQNRLEKIGLGPFCLELHSNKAKKKDVLAQLEAALNVGRIKPPEEYEQEAQRLFRLRRELNETVRKLHGKQSNGFSLYEWIALYEQHREAPDAFCFEPADIASLTPGQYRQREEICGRLRVSALACGGAANHPLREIRSTELAQAVRQKLPALLQVHAQQVLSLSKAEQKINSLLSLQKERSFGSLRVLAELCRCMQGVRVMTHALLEHPELSLLQLRLQEVCAAGLRRDQLREELSAGFHESIYSLDGSALLSEWNEAQTKWFLPKLIGSNRVANHLKICARDAKAYSREETASVLRCLQEEQQKDATIRKAAEWAAPLFGVSWNEGGADWQLLQTMMEQALTIRKCLAALEEKILPGSFAFAVAPEFLAAHAAELSGFTEAFDALMDTEQNLSAELQINFERFDQNTPWDSVRTEANTRWREHLDGLRSWCSFLLTRREAEECGLTAAADALENGSCTAEQLTDVFYRAVSQAGAAAVIDQDHELSAFSGALLEEKIARYKAAGEHFSQLTKNELAARLSARVPATSQGFAGSSEIGILQKAIRSGGRMLSIRRLFDSIPNLLRRLCPCLLMSPISVAQYIDPKFPPFDLVVFDEASQLPTCEAVGAIARGKNLVVVGDPKQLPPTSFFSVNRIDEENYAQEDLESILDDCLALSMPQEHLLWHYRSRHESLIAFSNRQYYDNKLFTFPSPNDLVSKVRFVPVEGCYDRGKTKQNRAEAQAVVDEIARRLRDPELCRQSIGVVTFSSVQQNLIDDMLLELFAAEPELETVSDRMYEPIFIKNLENVQGDERDVVLFSVGYGPDQEGKVTLNFGPLNQDGGWRRLNVAVTRARQEMVVFSVLRPEQIDLSRTRSDGIAGLRAFLEYAMRGKDALAAPANPNESEADLNSNIAERLRRAGLQVNTSIGCSEYKVDLGVVDPERPGEYILGIMCDGIHYRDAGTARDRNIAQEAVLKSLGWQICRIWALDWWEDPDAETEKICARVRQLQAGQPPVEPPAEEPRQKSIVFEREKPEAVQAEEQLPEYQIMELPPLAGGADAFFLPQNDRLLYAQVSNVLQKEAPVCRNVLVHRVLSAWGIARSGARIERRFDEILNVIRPPQSQINGVVFYWNSGDTLETYDRFRVPAKESERRNMDEIPPQEIAAGIRHILKRQISLSEEDLIRETARLFGFSRSSSAMEESIRRGIHWAEVRRTIRQEGERLIINEENAAAGE
ncbi:MAG: DUF3320 domain-containing protein [Firmicutes bacterium]|nr:DUF3320 domain-containing protein [Bacillota bacterium]